MLNRGGAVRSLGLLDFVGFPDFLSVENRQVGSFVSEKHLLALESLMRNI